VHERVEETQEPINGSIALAALLGAPFTVGDFGANALLDDDKATERSVGFIRPCPDRRRRKAWPSLSRTCST
jgi:hypothetical protein